MKKILCLALAAVCASPASAAQYIFDFSASGQIGSGVLTTSDMTFDSRGYTAQTITGISGTYNGSAITNLINGLFGSNNLYYVTGPSFVDGSGLGFGTDAGNKVNLFFQDSIPSYRVNTLNPFGSTFVSARSSLAAGGVPEPETWALMLLGIGAAGWSLRRRQPLTLQPIYAM